MDASSVSSEDSDDGLEQIGQLTSRSSYEGRPSASVKTLASWLEQASLRPLPSQRGELMDVAVVLSSLVRSRTELLRLKSMSSNPQIEAELLAADAVRIHLGLLERLDTAPEKKTSRLTETCKQWRQVLEQLSADSGLSSGANRLTAWKMVRPGAKPADPRDEIRTASPAGLQASASAYTLFRPVVFDGMVTSQVTAGPVLRGPARQVFTQTTQHRSPSPMVTRTVWPPMLVGPPQLRVSSSTAMLGTASMPGSGTAMPGPGTAVPGPSALVPVPAVPGPAPGGVTRFVSTAAVPRSATPLMARSASTRWTSPIRRASTPIPRQNFGPTLARGLERPVEVATTRAAPCVSPMPSRGREYRSLISSPYTSDLSASPQHQPPAGTGVSPGIHMLSPQAQSVEASIWMPQLGPQPSSLPLSAPRLVATGSLQATPESSSGYAAYHAQSLPSPGLCLASQARLGEVDDRSPGTFADTLRMLDFMSGSFGTSLTRLFSDEDLRTGEDKGEESTERQSQDPQDAPEEQESLRPMALPKRGLKSIDSARGGRGTTSNTLKSKAGRGRGKLTAGGSAAFVRPVSKSRQTLGGTAQDANRRSSPGRSFQASPTDDDDRKDEEFDPDDRVEEDEFLPYSMSRAAGAARSSGREGDPMRSPWR